nr:hypothetical protein BaRGS_014064 [Batillaria attramentaria]
MVFRTQFSSSRNKTMTHLHNAFVAIIMLTFCAFVTGARKSSPQPCLDGSTECRSMKAVFKQQAKRGETLDEFLKSTVEPTKAETTEKRQEIDKFVRAFQKRFKTHKPFTVAQVLKGGSLGKGTAIKGSADIDLVVFFNGLPTVDDLKRELPNLLQIIQDEVKDHSEWKGRVKQVKVTPYSVTFTLDGQKVDILPASEAIRRDLKSPTKIYSTIESSRDGARKAARHYSTSLAPLQVEFVKKVPGSLKGVIGLLKYWKQENNVNIRSYSLELLAIHVSQEYSTLKSTNDLFRECMRLLADPSNIQIAFGQHYDSHKYTRPADVISFATYLVIDGVCICGVQPVLFLIGVPTNILSCIVFARQGLRDRMNLLLFSLALVDLLFVALFFLTGSYCLVGQFRPDVQNWWKFFARKYFTGLYRGFLYTSGCLTMIIAVERCLCVAMPLKAANLIKTRTVGAMIAATLVVIQTACCIYPLELEIGSALDLATGEVLYFLALTQFYFDNQKLIDVVENTFLMIVIPFTTFIVVTAATAVTVVKLKRAITWRETSGSDSTINKRQMALAKMLVVVSCVYILTAAPNLALGLSRLTVPGFLPSERFANIFLASHLLYLMLAMFNSSVNFFIYATNSSRDDRALQKVLRHIRGQTKNRQEAMMVMTQLNFRRYLSEQEFENYLVKRGGPVDVSSAVRHFPQPTQMGQFFLDGDFDILIITRRHGLIVGEMKSVGDETSNPQNLLEAIGQRVQKAVKQLNKAGRVLQHLVSDMQVNVNIRKTLMLPNVSTEQLTQVFNADSTIELELLQCLQAQDIASAIAQCLCKDSFESVQWWNWVVGTNSEVDEDQYESLLARFCGPATSIEVPAITSPRLGMTLRTPPEAVALTGLLNAITLYPDQLDLVTRQDLRLVFVWGPPGTGKTVVLTIKGRQWRDMDKDVHLLSSHPKSFAATSLIEHQLLASLTASTPRRVHVHKYDFSHGKDVDTAVDELAAAAKDGELYVIADEAYSGSCRFPENYK